MIKIRSSEITSEEVYLNRREFMKLGGVALGALALSACGVQPGTESPQPSDPVMEPNVETPTAGSQSDELGDPLNSYEDITHYNNYYEFSLDKEGVAEN